jgi:hypothetical protein
MIARIIFTCCLFLQFIPVVAQKGERTISFSGYDWSIRNAAEKQGPGPNYFSDSCVRTDEKGRLHLWIKKDATTGDWICPEITSIRKFGFGEYRFIVEGAIDRFDKNIVLGLFNYSGNDGLDEMDIDPKNLIFSSIFVSPASSISQLAMPVHINFWLFDGKPPADQNPVEILIHSFQFRQ